ncbi:MAG TPA: O-antigen ligase family protein [Anaerolineales bacterium]|nr:O-antigen ligase family protein [Anaerolineales bacterium]
MFDKNKLAENLRICARISFALMLILIPFRLRTVAIAHPRLGIFGDYTDFLFYAMDVGLLALVIFWILSLMLKPRRLFLGPIAVGFPLAGLLASAMISLITSIDPLLTFYLLTRYGLLLVLYLFIINELFSAVWFAVPAAIGVLLQSVIAVAQSLTQQDVKLQWLGEYSLDPTAPFISILEVNGTRFLRAYGLSDHPNILGGFLAFGMVILLSVVVARVGKSWVKMMAAFVFVCGSAGLFTTYSRSAWAALVAGCLLIFVGVTYQRNWRGLLSAFVLIVICAMAVSPLILITREYTAARFDVNDSFSNNRVERGSVVERLYLFVQAYRILEQNPWTGVGLGASVIAMQDHYPVFKMSYQPPHVSILAAAMELGYSGAMFYAALMALPFYMAFRGCRYWQDIKVITALALILSMIIIGLFDHYLWTLVPGRIMQWLAWGIFGAAVTRLETPNHQNESGA